MTFEPDMAGIYSQVTFNAGGGGATINVGPVDAGAAKVDVYWGTQQAPVLVYSSLTPGTLQQQSIYVGAVTGTSYTLTVVVTSATRTTQTFSTTPFVAAAGTIVVKILNQI